MGAWEMVENLKTLPRDEWMQEGYYSTEACSDSFCVKAKLSGSPVKLILAFEKEMGPDPDNCTAVEIRLCKDEWIVRAILRQSESYSALTQLDPAAMDGQHTDYRQLPLDADTYSARFHEPGSWLLIAFDAENKMFHYAVEVQKTIDGKTYYDWQELFPAPAWSGDRLYFGCCGVGELYRRPLPKESPWEDRGFHISRREFCFSGSAGDALIIRFPMQFFPHPEAGFLFWQQGNYIPFWRISQKCLFTYEFVETWAERGCYEPMSDRINAFNNHGVVLSDSAAQKVVLWEYNLVNPDYQIPVGQIEGKPIVQETYTLYPNGSGVRDIIYKPNKLDKWNELGEYIIVAAAGTRPKDHLTSDVLTLMDLEGHCFRYTGEDLRQVNQDPEQWKSTVAGEIEREWKVFIAAQHFSNGLTVFSAWPNDPRVSETFPFYATSPSITWHNGDHNMMHWPVNKVVYQEDFVTKNPWPGRVASHSSTFGIEYWNGRKGSSWWEDHYEKDPIDGRIYRRWMSMIGMTNSGEEEYIKAAVATWLYLCVKNRGPETLTWENDRAKRLMRISVSASEKNCHIALRTQPRKWAVCDPTFLLVGWEEPVSLTVDGQEMVPGTDFVSSDTEEGCLVWLKYMGRELDLRIKEEKNK